MWRPSLQFSYDVHLFQISLWLLISPLPHWTFSVTVEDFVSWPNVPVMVTV